MSRYILLRRITARFRLLLFDNYRYNFKANQLFLSFFRRSLGTGPQPNTIVRMMQAPPKQRSWRVNWKEKPPKLPKLSLQHRNKCVRTLETWKLSIETCVGSEARCAQQSREQQGTCMFRTPRQQPEEHKHNHFYSITMGKSAKTACWIFPPTGNSQR